MAAKGDPGKSIKLQWRTCLTCTTRLSELCYDTHTLCEKCRGQVCGYDSFCDECRLWTKDFRRMYMKHQRTLCQKRVSKEKAKAKAKSPPVVDDAASNASMESHVSLHVVILPLDPQSVDADDNLSNLRNIQNVDNIVEIQSQPEIPPPLSTPSVFDAGIIESAFTRLHELLDKFLGRRTPPRENVGSDRRSPTAGPSDIARPNPLAQVADMAPQGPDSAPGPSMATHVPPASGPSHHDAPSSGEFAFARVGEDEWEHVRSWSRRVSSPERLRDELGQTHIEITQLREIIDFSRARGRAPPDHYYRDLDILHARYDHLSLALAESRQAFASSRRGRSPVVASPAAAPRHLSLVLPHLAINDSHPKIVVVHVTPPAIFPVTAAFQKSAHANDSPVATSLATAGDSLQGIPPLQSDSDSLQGNPPLQSNGDSLQGIPLLQSDGDSLQGILIHLRVSTHPVPRLVMVLLRDPHRGLLLPIHLRLLGKIRKLMNLLFLPRFGL